MKAKEKLYTLYKDPKLFGYNKERFFLTYLIPKYG